MNLTKISKMRKPPWCRFEAPFHSQCPKKQLLPEDSCLHHRPEARLCLPNIKKLSALRRMRGRRRAVPPSALLPPLFSFSKEEEEKIEEERGEENEEFLLNVSTQQKPTPSSPAQTSLSSLELEKS